MSVSFVIMHVEVALLLKLIQTINSTFLACRLERFSSQSGGLCLNISRPSFVYLGK